MNNGCGKIAEWLSVKVGRLCIVTIDLEGKMQGFGENLISLSSRYETYQRVATRKEVTFGAFS
jgi:hypothetical protein